MQQKLHKLLAATAVMVMLLGPVATTPVLAKAPAAAAQVVRQISIGASSSSFPATGGDAADVNGVQMPEIADEIRPAEGAAAASPQTNAQQLGAALVNRSLSLDDEGEGHSSGPLTAPVVKGSNIAGSNPGLLVSFNGLNHRNQRLANGGNQFSLEPPDQGLCVGNGFVMETVNDVLRVFDANGAPLSAVTALNTFYGYPAAINRGLPPGAARFGPFITDPSCYYDPDTQRWFHVVLTLEVDPVSGAFLGPNHLDLAVSTSSSPLGGWVVYRLPVQDDGTDGTPDHHCPLDDAGNGHGPCLGDYPHIGADKYGFYITTNEYAFFPTNTFISAQIYAFSKKALAANSASVSLVQFDTSGAVNSRNGPQPGFTVWPAEASASKNSNQRGGAEFFLSSNAGEEANGIPGGSFSNELIVWALTNTKSLNSASPALTLSNKVLRSETYGIPPKSDQKAGDTPLGDCLNDTSSLFGPDLGCWFLFFDPPPTWQPEVESHLDSNDTRMQQVWYANGKLWGALDTVVSVDGQERAGIAYFIVEADVEDGGHLEAEVARQGYVAVAGNNVTYPAIAVLSNGKGVMAFTLVGQDYYPSAGYVSIDRKGTGDVHVAASGLGPDDGFTSYKAFVGDPPRTRWGDYGAAVTDGRNIWMASEYIAQTCNLDTYLFGGPIGSCGGTRTALANWATRVTQVQP